MSLRERSTVATASMMNRGVVCFTLQEHRSSRDTVYSFDGLEMDIDGELMAKRYCNLVYGLVEVGLRLRSEAIEPRF